MSWVLHGRLGIWCPASLDCFAYRTREDCFRKMRLMLDSGARLGHTDVAMERRYRMRTPGMCGLKALSSLLGRLLAVHQQLIPHLRGGVSPTLSSSHVHTQKAMHQARPG